MIPYHPTPATTKIEAEQAVKDWLKSANGPKFASFIFVREENPIPARPKGGWYAHFRDQDNHEWFIRVDAETGRVINLSSPVIRPPSKSSKFTKGEDALAHIQTIAAPFVSGYEMTLTSFSMPTSGGVFHAGGGAYILYRGQGGGINAQYSILKHGYPFLDQSYGVTISLDSATGVINSYSETLNPPKVGAPVPLILPAVAIAEAERTSHVSAGTFKDAIAILGWATPKGARQAELYWKVDATSSGASYPSVFVDAKLGKADPRIVGPTTPITSFTITGSPAWPLSRTKAPAKPSSSAP